MNKYQVVLMKSYIVTINAENKENAKQFSEYYTNDIQDISTSKDHNENHFLIENIDCKMNEAFEIQEVKTYERD